MAASFLFRKHLEEDETLVRVVHKHWFLGIRSLFWPTIFCVLSLLPLFFNTAPLIVLASAALLLVCMIWWLRNFFDFYLDAWIVTDQGIIDIAWFGWFHRQSTRVLYSDLQGVSYEINGMLGTLLRYGTISVEKISTGTAVSLEYVRRPKKVEMMILQCMEQYLHKKNMKDSKQIQALLSSLIAERMQLQELSDE